mgnify:CR=1 FL=1
MRDVVILGSTGSIGTQALDVIAPRRDQFNVVALTAGGVAANSRLREMAETRCAQAGLTLRIPRPRLCTDNGAMVAMLGVNLVEAGVAPSAPDFPIDSAMPLTKVSM